MKMIKKMLITSLLAAPLLSVAMVYQYDPTARLVSLQATYPGGVEGLYIFCTNKFAEKMDYLKNLGVSFSDDGLKQDTYRFLASCIYGDRDYKQAGCDFGGNSCTRVNLPVDLPTLKHLSGADKIQSANLPPVNNLAANLY